MKGGKVGQTSVKKIQTFLALVLNQVSLQTWFFCCCSFIWGKGQGSKAGLVPTEQEGWVGKGI